MRCRRGRNEPKTFTDPRRLAGGIAARVVDRVGRDRVAELLAITDVETVAVRQSRQFADIARVGAHHRAATGARRRGGAAGRWVWARLGSCARIAAVETAPPLQFANHYVDVERLRTRHDDVVAAAVQRVAGINDDFFRRPKVRTSRAGRRRRPSRTDSDCASGFLLRRNRRAIADRPRSAAVRQRLVVEHTAAFDTSSSRLRRTSTNSKRWDWDPRSRRHLSCGPLACSPSLAFSYLRSLSSSRMKNQLTKVPPGVPLPDVHGRYPAGGTEHGPS